MEERTITMTVEEYKKHVANEVRIECLRAYIASEKFSVDKGRINAIFGFESTENES